MLVSEQADTGPPPSQVHVHMQAAHKNNHIPLTRVVCCADFGTQMRTTLPLRSISPRNRQHEPQTSHAHWAAHTDSQQARRENTNYEQQTLQAQYSSYPRPNLPREAPFGNGRKPPCGNERGPLCGDERGAPCGNEREPYTPC